MKKETVKLPKGVTQEFLDLVEGMQADDLKASIVNLQIQNQENEAFKESPEYLEAADEYADAKVTWNYINEPVKETTVSLNNRTKIVVDLLKSKGGDGGET